MSFGETPVTIIGNLTGTATSPADQKEGTVITGTASREGSAADNADAAVVYALADGTTAAAVVDGVGHGPYTSRTAPLLAAVAARIAARRGVLPGLLTAGELVADRGADGQEADAVAAAVRYRPGAPFASVAWCGDCRAYGWNGRALRRYTTDHTMGEQLRRNGAPWEIAADHDNLLTTSLSTAVVGTVYEVRIPDEVIILTTDGVHDQVEPGVLDALVRERVGDPQALADGLVAAASQDESGYRDDATAIVLSRA